MLRQAGVAPVLWATDKVVPDWAPGARHALRGQPGGAARVDSVPNDLVPYDVWLPYLPPKPR
jgi:hypothetical protein